MFINNQKRYILLCKFHYVKIEESKIIYKFIGQAMSLNLAYQPNVVSTIAKRLLNCERFVISLFRCIKIVSDTKKVRNY